MLSRQLSRRAILKGLGVTIALPFLEAMLPRTLGAGTTPPAFPKRMVFVYIPNGALMRHWKPTGTGSNYTLGRTLAPLERFKSDMIVFANLADYNARGGGAHASTMPSYLSGISIVQTRGDDVKAGITCDQFAAQQIGRQTRIPSLELSCEYGQQDGFCDTGYTCIYQNNLSWSSPTTPAPKEVNPRLVFDRLFAGQRLRETSEVQAQRELYNMSILDFVREQAAAINRDLGVADRRRMDEYLTSIRGIEQRIQAPPANLPADPGMPRPTRIPSVFSEHFRLMSDLLTLALQGDVTRISTLVMGTEGTRRAYPELGFTEEHHGVSHHQNNAVLQEKYTKINEHHAREVGYFIDRVKSIREGEGTMLDNCMIVYGGGIADGNAHAHVDLPTILFGKGGGTIDPGRHAVCPPDTPICNLYLSLFDRLGVRAERFGDSTGRLKELTT